MKEDCGGYVPYDVDTGKERILELEQKLANARREVECLTNELDELHSSRVEIASERDTLRAEVERLTLKTPSALRPKIVCLCGSGRFIKQFEEAEFNLTISGVIVLTIGCNTKDIARDIDWSHYKPMLDELHKRKIDLADEVLVLNIGGYIGESTWSEVEYAREHGKEVRYLETMKECIHTAGPILPPEEGK